MSARSMMLALVSLWLAVLGSAAGVIYLKHQARSEFVELERLNAERDRLNIEWGRLQLEQSAWSSYGWVEQVASRQLRMTLPNTTDVKIVQP